MNEKLRIALVGAGNISYHHLVAWQRNPAAEVVAICDPDDNRASARAREFAIPAQYANYAEMLRRERLDAVDIASPMDTHAPYALAAAGQGLHALCQKPLCPTLAEAQALVDAMPAGARLMVHENWRFRPWYRTVAGWLAAERVGTVRQVRVAWFNAGMLPDATGKLPMLAKQAYMGKLERLMVAEVLIHHLDTLRWLFGPLRVEAAVLGHGSDVVAGETYASALLTDRRGTAIVLEGNMMAAGHPARPTDALEILGDGGRIALAGSTLSLDGEFSGRQELDMDAGYQASFDAVIAHFTACLRSGAAFETAPADNLETLKLVEAFYDAARAARVNPCAAPG